MFLNKLLQNNRKFVEDTLKLYNEGKILPDSYCIDVDMFLKNAKLILDSAKKNNIKLYYMLKQVGRNPYLAKKLEELGYSGAVCVDFKEIEVLMKSNCKICNVGHLVQIPKVMLSKVISYGVDIITVYSYEMIEEISKISKSLNIVQDIMLRMVDENSEIYCGQEAGFSFEDVENLLPKILKLDNIRLNGLTSFPCFLYSENDKKLKETNNLKLLLKEKEYLDTKGFKIEHINLPSVTTVENIELISKYGGTEAEPGHAFTGTTPLNVHGGVEHPAYLYISEISHTFNGNSYFYGGGYYPRGNMKYGYIDGKIVEVDDFNSENIDYYLSLKGKYDIFKSIILAFRTQIFVTRSDVVLIEGIHNGNIKILGRYDSHGIERRI